MVSFMHFVMKQNIGLWLEKHIYLVFNQVHYNGIPPPPSSSFWKYSLCASVVPLNKVQGVYASKP